MTKYQGGFEIADMIHVDKDPARVRDNRVKIAWVGVEDEKTTWNRYQLSTPTLLST